MSAAAQASASAWGTSPVAHGSPDRWEPSWCGGTGRALRRRAHARAGELAPAERHGVVVEQGYVDPHHAGLDLVDGARALGEVLGVDVGARPKPERFASSMASSRLRDLYDRRHRTEGLVVDDLHVGRHAREHGRVGESAVVEPLGPPAAAGGLGALLDGLRQYGLRIDRARAMRPSDPCRLCRGRCRCAGSWPRLRGFRRRRRAWPRARISARPRCTPVRR